MNRHVRKAALVTAAITAGLLMTACQNGSASSGSSGDGAKNGSGSQHRSASKTSGHGTSAGSSAKRGSAAAARNASSTGHGVTGAFTGGTVSYLAPGKYLVHAPGKTDQEFYVADDTAVYGAGKVCGSPRSEARPRCTLDQLETATEKAAVTADVTLKNGIATVVRERHDVENGSGTGATGVNGTWLGNVSYLAPGKYTVSDMKGVEQAFYVAEDTAVRGAGTICGSPMSQSMYTCTLDQLEAAAKKGVSAKVVIADGVATSVTEDR
ncbi:hypothetical protein ACIBL8_16265 [Streptomyces sp. NPDC050523]|uniref:hypothetical protein n=1 Tax=Streptomyces sp. NPDC050523 TaxID=3365622 RepID=UPI003796D3BA